MQAEVSRDDVGLDEGDDGRVVSNFIVQAIRGEPLTIYGTGSQTRSFCYVDDLTEAMVLLMGTPAEFTGPVNVGNPIESTMLELAELVLGIVGGRSRLEFRPLPQDDPRQRCRTFRWQENRWAGSRKSASKTG